MAHQSWIFPNVMDAPSLFSTFTAPQKDALLNHHVVYVPSSTAQRIRQGHQQPIFLIPNPAMPGSFVPAIPSTTTVPLAPQQQQQQQQQLPTTPPPFIDALPFMAPPAAPQPQLSLPLDMVFGLDSTKALLEQLSSPPMSPPLSIIPEDLLSLPPTSPHGSPSLFDGVMANPAATAFIPVGGAPTDLPALAPVNTPEIDDFAAFLNVDIGTPAPIDSLLLNPLKRRYSEEPEEDHHHHHHHTGGCCSVKKQRTPTTSPTPSTAPSTPSTGPAAVHACPHPGCPKTFARRSHLVSHIITHTDAKNYTCDACPAVFARCHDLQRHQRSKHAAGGGKPFRCPHCLVAFARKDSLKKHGDRNCKASPVALAARAKAAAERAEARKVAAAEGAAVSA
ncbi:hypothetical protein HDU96_000721 [Phlyctochytrium bullatum]|nr:hypothetical protein HDU96_000721 [Phlyctochytrium bullatum]